MDYLASMYIDNELDLGEKVLFVEKIRSEDEFYKETVDLIMQEKVLRTQPERLLILAKTQIRHDLKSRLKELCRPFIYVGTGFALAALLVFLRMTVPNDQFLTSKRFVIYDPAASRIELTGTFNGWQRVDMKQVGTTGYWELNIKLPSGEHKFAYILDGTRRITDPTQLAREKDDFGGENSILNVTVHT